MLMILVQWILHRIPNHLSQYHLGVQFDLCFFGALSPIRHFSNDRCPSMKRSELLRPSSLLHRSPLSCFWLSSGSTPKSFPIFPFLIHCCHCCGNFHGLRHRYIFVCQIVMLQWIVSLLLQYGLHDNSVKILPYAVLWIHWLPIFTQVLIWISLVLLRVAPCWLFLLVLQGIAGAIGVSNF